MMAIYYGLSIHRDVAWAQREAYLELARREGTGLPLIDANLIEPSRVELPSDEELGDFEIII
jgi:NADH dehydrogenase (ubiquinone) 1 beta subcomplex subunit 11